MAKRTFGWFPDVASEASEEPAVNVTKYGDGYESRTSDTMNVNRQNWRVTFTRGRASGESLAIRQFLQDHQGKDSFLWTNPFGELLTVVARKWTAKSDRGEITVSTTFEQVFEQ